MPKLLIRTCQRCTTTITDLMNIHGRDAAMQAMVSIVADCFECQTQLPPELRASVQAGQYETREKGAPPPDTFVEKRRIILP